eukprot:gnl/TRDRNA2_/TRDRNA2_118247_c1_seq2.p2 gnl/TRDRNA2_/TRDRNA2_118247_c1~~gnl/TRDRNA2_/TRDRNA2_118247_c1_seq2.p2  ORF type:complete len:109 (-),score=0.76 gnl/TRDRNA2_/TRDRNA2_118247_c1_seq2:206-532(-)
MLEAPSLIAPCAPWFSQEGRRASFATSTRGNGSSTSTSTTGIDSCSLARGDSSVDRELPAIDLSIPPHCGAAYRPSLRRSRLEAFLELFKELFNVGRMDEPHFVSSSV